MLDQGRRTAPTKLHARNRLVAVAEPERRRRRRNSTPLI